MNKKVGASLLGFILIGVIGAVAVIVAQNRVDFSSSNSQTSKEIAPSIQLSTSDGQTIDLPGSSGQVTVLYTMGYWCADCVPGAKTLAQLQPEYLQRGVRFIAIDVTPKVKATDLEPFLQAVGDNQLTWALDTSGRFAYLYKIQTLDTAIVLDKQGHEVYRNQQSSSDTAIRAALDKVLE